MNSKNSTTNNKSRSTLTLKLKSGPASAKQQDRGPITIKNRKNRSAKIASTETKPAAEPKDQVPDNLNLSSAEFEIRKKLLDNAAQEKKSQVSADDILNKIHLSNKAEEEKNLAAKKAAELEAQNEEKVEAPVKTKPAPKFASDKASASKEKGKKHHKYKDFDSEEEVQSKKPNKNERPKRASGKKTFIIDQDDDDSSGYYRKKRKKEKKIHDESAPQAKIFQEVAIPEFITVSELASRMNEKVALVVKTLFSMGTMVTANQTIDADTAQIVVEELGHKSKIVASGDVENILEENIDHFESLPRPPVVTIMGHVDHGKTSLLDALRSTDIVAGESGGITQHIGASSIEVSKGKSITFLDTPGHEAFTQMRSRGANATDIVVLVVAADDGVKAQTIEAINHAKAAEVPIIVAVNKIDKPGADPSRVKNELLEHEVVAEDMGGDIMFVEVSAKAKQNLDALQEAILLQAEMLELKAPQECNARGVVVEAKTDPGKGVVATLLVQIGTLKVGDLVLAGTSYGKVRKMYDEKNHNCKIVKPAIAVEVLGFNTTPSSGDQFAVLDEERKVRDIITYRQRRERDIKATSDKKSVDDLFKIVDESKQLNLVIKADVHGSIEAITGSLAKLENDEVSIKVLHSAPGGITESDISLAAVSNALVLGFNVRANQLAKDVASERGIEIRYYSIIYDLVDEIKALLSGLLDPIKSEEVLGHAEVRQIFKVSGAGKIAGSFVTNGVIKRGSNIRLLRDNVVIHDGKLKTLRRFKDDVKEVNNNFECGIVLENFDDIKEGDTVECYDIIEEKRSL